MRLEPERWRELEKLFAVAFDCPPSERTRVLDKACSDPEARRQVEALLDADEEAQGFLKRPLTVSTVFDRFRSVGPYRLVRPIGEGGVSEVWLAIRADEQFRRRVAIKLLRRRAVSDEERRRLDRERQILASLDHPRIARLYDAGTTEDGLAYFVMELIVGEPITDFCEQQELTIAERLDLFQRLCAAVHYAHQNLVVHRDLKPSNILVTESGEPKLLDFGIAKLINPELVPEGLVPTHPWHRVLTPDYASPEQIQGKAITTASDVYSLGVVLYQLLTGTVPHRLSEMAPSDAERVLVEREPDLPSVAARARSQPPSPGAAARHRPVRSAQWCRRLTGDLDTIVRKALSKAPHRRYSSVAQLAEDIQRHQQGIPVLARPPTFFYRTGRFLRRHRHAVAAAVAVLSITLAAVVGLGMLSLRLSEERDQVAIERDKARHFSALLKDVFEVADPGEASLEMTAREILRRGADRVMRLPLEQAEIQAELLSTLGNVYRRLGQFGDAAPLLESALSIRQRIHDSSHPAVAESLVELASLRRDAGDYKRAETLFREGLARFENIYQEDHGAIGAGLLELGVTLREQGRYEEAEALLRRALTLYRGPLAEDRDLRIRAVSQLAGVLQYGGHFEEAEDLHREALSHCREHYGTDHVATALALNGLASCLIDRGSYQEPEPLLEEALAINRARRMDANHPNVISGLSNLGALATFQKDFAKAEAYYREAQERARVSMGEDHPNVSFILIGLGASRRKLGDARGAERVLRQATDIRRQSFGPTHFLTAKSQVLLGACLLDRGQYDEAESLFLGSLRVIEALEPPRPRERGRVLGYLKSLYEALGQPEEVVRYQALLSRNISP